MQRALGVEQSIRLLTEEEKSPNLPTMLSHVAWIA